MCDHLSCRHIVLFRYERLGLLRLVIAGGVLQVGHIELEVLELLLRAVVGPGNGDRGGRYKSLFHRVNATLSSARGAVGHHRKEDKE